MDKVILSSIGIDELITAVREVVREELKSEQSGKQEAQLLSPSETCKLFNPSISRVTLSSWTRQGYLQEHRMGSKIYYKYGEVINAVKTLKKYKRPDTGNLKSP